MSWWLLVLVGLSMFDFNVTINGNEYQLSFFLRLITFICCCIWG